MAPTTRSARLSIEAQTFSCKAASSSRAITANTPICKAESFQEERGLRTCKFKANEKPDGALQRKVRTARARKEKKMSQVDQEEATATDMDMEDLCSSGGCQSDPVFLESEVMAIRTKLLSWYDRNHRHLPWRINIHSCLQNPSYSADEPDERCKEASSIEVKKGASHLGGDSVHAAVYYNNITTILCDVFFERPAFETGPLL